VREIPRNRTHPIFREGQAATGRRVRFYSECAIAAARFGLVGGWGLLGFWRSVIGE
jgi:hypothetical protein